MFVRVPGGRGAMIDVIADLPGSIHPVLGNPTVSATLRK